MGDPLKPFREIHARELKSYSVRDALDSHGYLLVRELLPHEDLRHLLGEIMYILSAAGWLLPVFRAMHELRFGVGRNSRP